MDHPVVDVTRVAAGNDTPPDDVLRYDGIGIAVHWITAALVIVLFALAQGWGFLPRGNPARHFMQSLHVALGLVLTVTLLLRIVWRAAFGRRLPPASTGVVELAARGMHYVLYCLLVLMVIAGFGKQWLGGHSVGFFSLFSIPSPIPADRAWLSVANTAHSWGAWAIIILAGLHAAAALFHHYLLRDAVLRRMLPGRRLPAAD
jgi:cytochrome b561